VCALAEAPVAVGPAVISPPAGSGTVRGSARATPAEATKPTRARAVKAGSVTRLFSHMEDVVRGAKPAAPQGHRGARLPSPPRSVGTGGLLETGDRTHTPHLRPGGRRLASMPSYGAVCEAFQR